MGPTAPQGRACSQSVSQPVEPWRCIDAVRPVGTAKKKKGVIRSPTDSFDEHCVFFGKVVLAFFQQRRYTVRPRSWTSDRVSAAAHDRNGNRPALCFGLEFDMLPPSRTMYECVLAERYPASPDL